MANDYYGSPTPVQPGTTVRSANFNDNNDLLEQGFDLLPDKLDLYGGTVNFGISTGATANVYEVDIQLGRIVSYYDGLTIQVRAHQDNTGASQVNLNSLGNRNIVTTTGTALVAGDILEDVVMVLRYNASDARFVLDTALTIINDAANRAEASAAAALVSENNAAASASSASASASAASASAASASTDADRAETAASIVGGTLLLPTLNWSQGSTTTDPLQRYLFDGNLYVAPEATVSNPISLGATPVGDSNWVSWSSPIRFFAYEETTVAPKSVFDVGTSFEDMGDVFVDTLLMNPNSYTTDGILGTLTFNENVPTGTFVRIWVGRDTDAIVNEINTLTSDSITQIETARDSAITDVQNEGTTQIGNVQSEGSTQITAVQNAGASEITDIQTTGDAYIAQQTTLRDETIAAAATVDQIIDYDAGTIGSPTTIFRPGIAFDKADLYAGGVPQRRGASYSYIIEVDSLDSNFNQITFSEAIPAGTALFGTLRVGAV